MSQSIINRIYNEVNYIIDTKQTIREIAKAFKVSKSTVHKDLHERLYDLDNILYNDVNEILKEHIETRHIKGGEATRKKYLNLPKSI